MALSAVRKVSLSGFMFPRHTMPMLVQSVQIRSSIAEPRNPRPVPAYHEVCGFVRVSGRFRNPFWNGASNILPVMDLLDVLRAPVATT